MIKRQFNVYSLGDNKKIEVYMEYELLIKRINELSRKSKAEGLTEDEKAEQTELRNEYRQRVVGSLRSQLDHTSIQNPDGSITKLNKK